MTRIGVVVVAALTLVTPLPGQDHVASLLSQYHHEADPVRRTRTLIKLGDAQIDLAQQQLKDGEDVRSLETLQQYRDEVKETVDVLTGMGVDAEKKPAGFKELQISLRQTVRKIDDLILTLPVDKRPFFREVRTDLVKEQNELIDVLFPRRPDQNSRKPNT